MNFDDAIKAHVEWKIKLNTYLNHPDNSIDPVKLSLDNVCALGQWLYSDGKAYAHFPEYQELVKEHAGFHKSAGDIVHRKNAGQDVSADTALGSESDFSKYSMRVVKLLLSLKSKI